MFLRALWLLAALNGLLTALKKFSYLWLLYAYYMLATMNGKSLN